VQPAALSVVVLNRWRLLVLAAAAAAAFVPLSPDLVEELYSNGLYPPLQAFITSWSNRTPLALFDFLIAAVVVGWAGLLLRDLSASRGRWIRVLVPMAVRTTTFAAALYLVFLLTWGLNYRRVPLEDKLQLDSRAVTPQAAVDLAIVAASELNRLAPGGRPAADAAASRIDPALARAFEEAQRQLGAARLALPGRPKRTLLDGYFRAASVDGMTDPYFLETMAQSALLPVERPMVVAHEWAHLAGYADEGEANFVGWLTCLHGDEPALYSGWLFLYSETAQGLGATDRARVSALLGPAPRADLTAIAQRMRAQASPTVSAVGWRVYDQYLRANGIEQGTRSYTDVVRLVLGTQLGSSARAALTSAVSDRRGAGSPSRAPRAAWAP
jgi:hypothetical protein